LNELAESLSQQYPIKTKVYAKDLSQPGAAKDIYQQLHEEKIQINILVNNAGFGTHGLFAETDLNETLGMIAVNMTSLTELTHLFLPDMLKQKKGKILNVASTAAFQAGPSMAVYCATKSYVLSFSEALAIELKKSGVTVTALCPGVTPTSFQKRAKMQHLKIMKNTWAAMDAKTVAEIGFNSLLQGKPEVITGFLNNMSAFITRLLPRQMAARIAGVVLR
jgi:short-subunit dehydrogenase